MMNALLRPFENAGLYLASMQASDESLRSFYNADGLSLLGGAERLWLDLSLQEREQAIAILLKWQPQNRFSEIAWRSFLARLTQEPKHLSALFATYDDDETPLFLQYFLHWQIAVRAFHAPGTVEAATTTNMIRRYRSMVAGYGRAIGPAIAFIPPEQRDWSRTPVVTVQFLTGTHAPTRDVLDYARQLREIGIEPTIINAALIPRSPIAPFYDALTASYVAAYSDRSTIADGRMMFDFHQPRQPMPDVAEIREMVRRIHAMRPGFILSCGSSNLVADICAQFTTVITIPFGTELQISASNLYVLPRALREGDAEHFIRAGFSPERVLALDYSFALPHTDGNVARSELGLDPDSTVLAVVGSRLDHECDATWMSGLSGFLRATPEITIVFAGKFANYQSLVATDSVLRERTRFVGFFDDIVGLLTVCDGFLNPPRQGGASTAAYALALGQPVFSPAWGDVANTAGEARHEADWTNVATTMRQCRTTPKYLAAIRKRSRERWHSVSDRKAMIGKIAAFARAGAEIRV